MGASFVRSRAEVPLLGFALVFLSHQLLHQIASAAASLHAADELVNDDVHQKTLPSTEDLGRILRDVYDDISDMKTRLEELEARNGHLEEENSKLREQFADVQLSSGMRDESAVDDAVRRRRQGLDPVAFDVYSTAIYDVVRSVISYQGALVNVGDAISPDEGVFRAPYAGVYAFAVHFDERDGATARIQIRVNEQAVATVASHEPSDDSGSGESVVVQLAAGDRVDTYLVSGSIGGDADTHFNGFLVAEIF